jgi:hypothetical protein
MITNISKEITASIFGGISIPKVGVTCPDNENRRLLQSMEIIYQTTQCRNPEDYFPNSHCHENLKSHFKLCIIQQPQNKFTE